MSERIISPAPLAEEGDDLTIRPERLDEFVGQAQVKESLKISIEAAQKREEPIDHILFSGPPGLGKTTLAHIIAREMGAEIRPTTGPVLDPVFSIRRRVRIADEPVPAVMNEPQNEMPTISQP